MTSTADKLQKEIESLIRDRVVREAHVRTDSLTAVPVDELREAESAAAAWQTASFLEELVNLARESDADLGDAVAVACQCLRAVHDSVYGIERQAARTGERDAAAEMHQAPEVYPSDVIAHVLRRGIEATLQEFPSLHPYRAAVQNLLDASAELDSLELKHREAQVQLDAADKELVRLLSNSDERTEPVAA